MSLLLTSRSNENVNITRGVAGSSFCFPFQDQEMKRIVDVLDQTSFVEREKLLAMGAVAGRTSRGRDILTSMRSSVGIVLVSDKLPSRGP
jgi:hypothetical protein